MQRKNEWVMRLLAETVAEVTESLPEKIAPKARLSRGVFQA